MKTIELVVADSVSPSAETFVGSLEKHSAIASFHRKERRRELELSTLRSFTPTVREEESEKARVCNRWHVLSLCLRRRLCSPRRRAIQARVEAVSSLLLTRSYHAKRGLLKPVSRCRMNFRSRSIEDRSRIVGETGVSSLRNKVQPLLLYILQCVRGIEIARSRVRALRGNLKTQYREIILFLGT